MKFMQNKGLKQALNIFAVCFWVLIIITCFVYKDKITVDSIVAFTPKNTIAAIAVLLLLFAVKSVSIFIYCGLLYAASGILFPLPLAILVNVLGSLIMSTIPFRIGNKAGSGLITELTEKYPKLRFLKDVPQKNELFMSFFVRIIGILPSDVVGMYLGATQIHFSKYTLGAALGMLPQAITSCIMGSKINDVTSPEFLISLSVEVCLKIVSISAYYLWTRRAKLSNGRNHDA